jgi:hypothetical protein
MPKSSVFDNDFIKLIFHGTPIPNIADNALTSPLTQYFLSLHTADPGVGGNQTTNECTYTGYTRLPLSRDASGTTVTDNAVTLTSEKTFPQASAGSETATHWAVGIADSFGTGKILYVGTLSPVIPITTGTIPVLQTATSITET